MNRSRVVVTIDEVVVDGVTSALPPAALVQRAIEQEVRRAIGQQSVDAWQSRSVDRVQASPAALGPAARVGDLAHAIATRVVSSATVAPASSRRTSAKTDDRR